MRFLLLCLAVTAWAAEDGYIDPRTCRACHRAIFDAYQQTGMGRSMAKVSEVPPLAAFDHAASGQQFSVVNRAGVSYLRRSAPPLEKSIDYAIGSGEHSRTYAHRDSRGKLIELPVSWYAEGEGSWHMSPGYDRPNHSGFQREVSDSCLFCHTGYPSKANNGLAEGIDCQRCHGPGELHANRKGPIVNPAKLSTQRRMEVCLQCHLESASRTLPDSIQRFGRSAFSYRPGEPLSDFRLYFEFVNPPVEDRVTVNGSAYGLMKSQCYLRSNGRLQCTTCHDPHRKLDAVAAEANFTRACRSCHPTTHEAARKDCAGCHMQKRRTEDAVHVVMTDHRIRRVPLPGDQLAMIPERHDRVSGPVKLLYPPNLSDSPDTRLYLAIANGDPAGIQRAIDETKPIQPEPYFALGEALRKAGRAPGAIRAFSRAIELAPADPKAYIAASDLMKDNNQMSAAIELLTRALKLMTQNTQLLNSAAVLYAGAQQFDKAMPLLSKAVAIAPDDFLTWLNFGVCLEAKGDVRGAANAYTQALVIDPTSARAKAYLNRVRQPAR